MSVRDLDPTSTVFELVNGYQVSRAVQVAAALGIPDLLVEGALTSDELAVATDTQAPTLYRLLRALASVGVLHESESRRFELTPVGERLRSDVPDSLADWAVFVGRPYQWQAWGGLLESVRTGENAFERVHSTDAWTYRAERPEESAIFDRAMAARSRQSSAALLAAYDFGRYRTIVDVGGGNGALLAAILAAHEQVEGVLFDQPHVVADAPALFEREGVSDRCRIVAGDFFESVPEGGDAYLLRAVVHDWDDDEATRILAAVRRAIPPEGTLLVVERIVAPPNEGRDTNFMDLHMLVVLGGRERTQEEFDGLLARAGFRMTCTASAGTQFVIEGESA
jgi:O-methyltransferase domain/Dimerisation domain